MAKKTCQWEIKQTVYLEEGVTEACSALSALSRMGDQPQASHAFKLFISHSLAVMMDHHLRLMLFTDDLLYSGLLTLLSLSTTLSHLLHEPSSNLPSAIAHHCQTSTHYASCLVQDIRT